MEKPLMLNSAASSSSLRTHQEINVSNDSAMREALKSGPRCPCILALDTSGSMEGEPIEELNRALEQFSREVLAAPELAQVLEVGLVGFGAEARVLRPVAPLQHRLRSTLSAEGSTCLGAALGLSLKMLESRMNVLGATGALTGTPWLVIITDGFPTDDWGETAASVKSLAKQKLLRVLAIGVGPDADIAMLEELCAPSLPPVRLAGLRFAPFFDWLTESLALSAAAGDETLALPSTSSWADLSTSKGVRQ
jgi:uncharacterized protein YegL